jgi:two-component system sensor histidine kinase/response regulator
MTEELKLDEVLDKDEVMERVDGDTELLMEIMDLFISDYPRLMLNIKNAIAQKDSKVLEQNAHALKGSVGNFSANSVFDIALSLEVMGRNNDMSNVEGTYINLEREIKRLMLAFDILRKEVAL